ncbi:ribosome maturation factor RimM [Bacteroidia bacterium]|nr:ribosome maturation factor RimM [Bacteroidia bacterium]
MGDFHIVGRISGLFAAGGELTIAMYDDFPMGDNFEGPLFVMIDKLAVPLFIGSLRRRGTSTAVVRFEDVDSVAIASTLVGLELLVPRPADRHAARPAARSVRGTDFEALTGYRALLAEGLAGEVAAFVENGANPLLEIDMDGKQIYVPAVDEFVEHIDPRRREVRFALPEGLLELYL